MRPKAAAMSLYNPISNRQTGSGGLYSEGKRTRTHYHRHRKQKGKPVAPGTKAAMGRSIQLLHQRRRLGPNLCADLPVLAVLGSGLPEPTSLDCQSFNPTR